MIGSSGLYEALKGYSDRPKYQRLVIEFEKGEDPDDAYSQVAYEKGANFILYLGERSVRRLEDHSLTTLWVVEKTLGGLDIFLPYVRDYVNTFIGKSITTDMWKSHLLAYFEKHGGEAQKQALKTVDWDVCLSVSTSTTN